MKARSAFLCLISRLEKCRSSFHADRFSLNELRELLLIKNESPYAVSRVDARFSDVDISRRIQSKRRRSKRDAVRDTVVTVWPNCVRVWVVN